jgi:predicted MFS family arabinose efflux permease
MFFFVTFFIQLPLGFSALRNGVANLPIALTVAVGAVVSGKLMPRIGPRNVVLIGAGFVAASLFRLSRVSADSGYFDTILPAMLLFAFGTGQVFVPRAPPSLTVRVSHSSWQRYSLWPVECSDG